MIAEDDYLREDYEEWCHAVGSSEKNGFLDYCEEYKNGSPTHHIYFEIKNRAADCLFGYFKSLNTSRKAAST